MYVARDKSGFLALFTSKPKRCNQIGIWAITEGEILQLDEDDPAFQDLTWEDEPITVTISRDGTQQD